MKVFLFAIHDNGQQHFTLADAMRTELGWDAKSMVMKESYLGFKTDWTYEKNLKEAQEFIEDTDLFIFQDMLMCVDGLELQKYAGHKNTIINGTGSMMRANIPILREMQKEGWKMVTSLCDSTIASHIASPPFQNWIVPIERINELTKGIERNEEFSICHAPTNTRGKGTEKIEKILKSINDIKYERVTGMSWEEAIKKKAKYHMIIDSMGDNCYNAGNSLEGLVLGQHVLTAMDGWCLATHDWIPITNIRENTETVIRKTIEEAKGGDRNWMLREEKEWVEDHFGKKKQMKRWKNFIDWVMQ